MEYNAQSDNMLYVNVAGLRLSLGTLSFSNKFLTEKQRTAGFIHSPGRKRQRTAPVVWTPGPRTRGEEEMYVSRCNHWAKPLPVLEDVEALYEAEDQEEDPWTAVSGDLERMSGVWGGEVSQRLGHRI